MLSRRACFLFVPLLAQLVAAGQGNQAAPAKAEQPATKQPVYVLLFSTIDDPLNMEASEERLQRTLPLLERYRTQFARYRASCLYQFSGTFTDALVARNNANHLLDAVRSAARQGIIEIGYDGTEEPTFLTRPRPNFRRAKTGEQRWLARSEAAEWFLNEYKDPVTGEPDAERTGGLKRVREVFDDLRSIAGVSLEIGGDSETVHQIRRQAFDGIMPGLSETTAYPARLLQGYRGGVAMFVRRRAR
jgi:hypothetical protein